MPDPKLSVVTVSWNTGPHLMECVTSVLSAPGVDELILVSHENPPATMTTLRDLASQSDKFTLIDTGTNLGFAKGCNIGVDQASHELVLFLNPDAVLMPGAASRLKASAQSLTRRPWIIGARTTNADGSEQRGARRGELTPMSAFIGFLGLRRIFPNLRDIHRENEEAPEAMYPIPTVSGAAMMMLRDDYLKVGGFDERYFLHVEDIDICRTVREKGGQVWFEPRANILHYGRTSRSSPLNVETHKAVGFVKYFWRFYPGPLQRLLTVLLIPLIYGAIWSRLIWLSVCGWVKNFFRRRKVRARYRRIQNKQTDK